MHRTNRTSQPGPSSSPARQTQDKVVLQREYREKEGECFNMLRGAIRGVTGEEPRTRQEILRKATDLLLSFSETGSRSEIQAGTPNAYGMSAPTGRENLTIGHLGYSAQLYWPPTSNVGIGPATSPYHGTHDQRYFPMDSPLNQSSFPAYGGSPDYLHFRRMF